MGGFAGGRQGAGPSRGGGGGGGGMGGGDRGGGKFAFQVAQQMARNPKLITNGPNAGQMMQRTPYSINFTPAPSSMMPKPAAPAAPAGPNPLQQLIQSFTPRYQLGARRSIYPGA